MCAYPGIYLLLQQQCAWRRFSNLAFARLLERFSLRPLTCGAVGMRGEGKSEPVLRS